MENNSEDKGVRRAFVAVRRDVMQMKRKLNQEMLKQDTLAKKSTGFVTKQEFYDYLNRLINKMDRLEESAVNRTLLTKFKDNVKERVNDIKDQVQRRDKLVKEVKEIGILKNALIELDGAKAGRAEFKDFSLELGEHSSRLSEIENSKADGNALHQVSLAVGNIEREKAGHDGVQKLSGDLANLKRELARRENLKERLKEISKLKASIDKIESRKVSRDSFTELRNKVDVMDERAVKDDRFTSRMATLDKRVSARLKSLDVVWKEINSIKDRYVNSSDFRRRVSALTSFIKEKANNIEEIKREFAQKVDLEDIRKRSDDNEIGVKRLKDNLSVMEADNAKAIKGVQSKIGSIEKEFCRNKKVAKIDSAVKSLDKDLDKVSEILDQFITKGDMEDLAYQIDELRDEKVGKAKFEKELAQIGQKLGKMAEVQARLQADLKKAASAPKVIVKKVLVKEPAKKKKMPKKGGPGILRRSAESVLDFFLEEEGPKKKSKKK